MKILVTGGTGYIGSHTVVELQNQGHQVEILDNLFNSKITVLDKINQITGQTPVFQKIDLLDYPKMHELFAATQFDAVIHFAGLKAVAESIEQPLRYYENNVTGTLNLLKCMAEFKVNKIIFSSSATVYGSTNSGKLDESMTTGVGITNPYGETKHVIEKILESEVIARPELSVVILRYFNPVGAHVSGLLGEDPNGIPNNLMPVVMRVAEGKIKELQVYGDDYDTPDGTCIRDYIHVVDLANGHLAALKATDTPGAKIYNLGSGKGSSVLEIIKAFEEASGKPLSYRITDRRPGDLAEIFADPSKAKRELDWQTELTVADAMRDTINFLNHQN
jgi:UDP-glucose 4-epimerase